MSILKYEIIENNEIRDVYRISYGVLLIINKFKYKNSFSYMVGEKEKEYLKRYKNISKCHITIKEYILWNKTIVPVGSIIYDYHVVEIITDPNEYYYEVKTTGSCYGGTVKEVMDINETIGSIISGYGASY